MKDSRKAFLQSVRIIIDYWSKVADTKEKAAQGTAFSIMCLLDGVSGDNLFGYTVIDNETGKKVTDEVNELHAEL